MQKNTVICSKTPLLLHINHFGRDDYVICRFNQFSNLGTTFIAMPAKSQYGIVADRASAAKAAIQTSAATTLLGPYQYKQ